MAKTDRPRLTIRGKTWFAKILGEPVPNYNKDGKEWTVDVILSKSAVKELKAFKLGSKIKSIDKEDSEFNGQPFIRFKQKAARADGTPNRPMKVVDITGKDWDQETLIGNGSDIDVTFDIVDYGQVKGIYVRVIRVLKLVPYTGGGVEIEELDKDDPFYAEYQAALKEANEDDSPTSDDSDDFDEDEIPF